MADRVKYPRTPHLPSSPGRSEDDVALAATDVFAGRDVVVTEKLDGENTTIGPGYVHARSLDSAPHPSRTWVRALAASVWPDLPDGMRVCGENLYARHSIGYEALPSWFQVFGVWDGDTCLSWDDTVEWCRLLGLVPVPVLHRGLFPGEDAVVSLWQQRFPAGTSEGFVVRDAGAFDRAEFGRRVGKWVRAGHVQTDQHWMTAPVVPNGLAP